jgi:hypothetical protein
MGSPAGICTLVSASCTTSWFDWVHGELWMCDDGLFRSSLGLETTLAHGRGPTVDPGSRPTRAFQADEIERIVSQGRQNRWVPWTMISHATLKRGFLDSSLHLELSDGRREKFLWLRSDGGYELLEKALPHRLPGGFELRTRPFA